MTKFKTYFGFVVMMLALATLSAGQGWSPAPYVNGSGLARGDVTIPTSSLFVISGKSFFRSGSPGQMSVEDNSAASFSRFDFGPVGAVNTVSQFQKTTSAIADNVATAVATVTIPNVNASCAIRILMIATNGSTDAFESTTVSEGWIAVARTTGVNAVATAAAIGHPAIATVAAGSTNTLAYALSAISGAVGASNTFTINVTIDDSGNLGSNQLMFMSELVNNAATGCQIA